MKTILLVEDDRELRQDLTILLERAGYEVLTASSAAEAQTFIFQKGNNIHLYLLDLWLPDQKGTQLLKLIRSRSTTPVLFLTVCDDEESVVEALNAGADDYITKPFRRAELFSRINANLRRQQYREEEKVLISNPVTLNPFSHTVFVDKEAAALRPVEFKLLYMLMRNHGRIVRRERLLNLIVEDSGAEEVEDNTLTVYISRIRSRIGGQLIETVKGVGYRFTQTVEERVAGDEISE